MPTSTSSYGKYSSYNLYSSYPTYRSPSSTSSYLNRTTSLDRSSYLSSSGSNSSSSSSSSNSSTSSSGSGSNYYRYYGGNKGLSSLPPRPSYSALSDSYRTSRSSRVSPTRSSYSRLSSESSYLSDREPKYSYNRIRDYSLTNDSGYDSYTSSRDRSVDLQNGNGSTSRRNSLRQYDYDYDRDADKVSVIDKIRNYESYKDPAEERLALRRRRLGLSPARDALDSLTISRTRSHSRENRNLEEKTNDNRRERNISPSGTRSRYNSISLTNGNLSAEDILGCSGGSGPTLVVKDTSFRDDTTPRSRLNSYSKEDKETLTRIPKSPSRSPRAKSPVEEKTRIHPKIIDCDADSLRSSYTLPFRSRDRKEKLKERIASRFANEVQSETRYSSSIADGINENKGLVGLRNIGNTCFMNSIIQCLSNTRCLLEYISKDDYLSDINTTLSTMKGELFKAFANLIKELWRSGTISAVNTGPFKAQIQRFAPVFTGYAQHDAQEFLRKLVEGLHEDVNRVQTKPKRNYDEIDDSLADQEKAMIAWKNYLHIDNSKIVDMFVGQLKSCLRCSVCNHESITFDPFWDLSLPIPGRSMATVRLSNCLDLFTKEEVMDGDEKPTCSKCKERRRMTKSFSIQKFPKVLVIHLKRFSPLERWKGKLSCTVDVPLENVDLSSYSAMPFVPTRYNLVSVVNHSGTPLSGHYTAYCKHPYLNSWHEYNDSRVSPLKVSRVSSAEAYVLFYELCSTEDF